MKYSFSTIVERLNMGNIGVIASDTLFGLIGKATDPFIVEKIYKVKKRDTNKPCIILISNIDQLDYFHIVLNKRFRLFLEKIWPGPVTVILRLEKKYVSQFEYLHRGTGELTFRLPKNLQLKNIIDAVGPILAPSANPEGLTPAESVQDIKKYFDTTVDVYLDPSDTPYSGKPSTIIKIKDHKLVLIREGVVPFEEIITLWTSLLQ